MGCESKNSDAIVTALREGLELKRLAERATSGPWEVLEDEVQQRDGAEHVVCFGHDYDEYGGAKPDDLAYIAACSPEVILKLIARAAEAERRLREIQEWAGRLPQGWTARDEALALLDTRAGQGEK